MNNPLILTFDVGTQSSRGMLVNSNGDIEAIEQYVYPQPYFSKNKDWAEQKADFYYEVICNINKALNKKYKNKINRIIGVTTTVFRDSTICLDENYKPLNDIILWLDKREINEKEMPISSFKKNLFKLVGAYDMVDMQHRQSICNYLMSRQPQMWKETFKYVYLSTYLNYKLTGNLIDSDANMIGHMPFDYKNRTWQKKNDLTRVVYDVEQDKLADTCLPGQQLGTICELCSKESLIKKGLPVIATGSDKGCETIGLSVISKNKAAVSFGTSATIQFTTPDYFEPKRFCPSYPAPIKGLYNPETQIYRGYWMLTWFKENFANEEIAQAKKLKCIPEDILNKKIENIPAGCDGLLLQPFWSPGVWNPNSKGSMIGFSDVHSKYHIYKAIIEGINYGIMDGLYTMQKRGHQKIDEIYIGGGGSKSNEICQITADMLGLPVNRIQTHEACGLGSSVIGFVSLGVFDDYNEAISKMVRVKDRFIPDAYKHKFYERIFNEVYQKLSKKLEPDYIKIKNILRGK